MCAHHTCVCTRTHPLHRSLEGCTQRCATPRCKWVTLRDTPLKKPVSPRGCSPTRHLSNPGKALGRLPGQPPVEVRAQAGPSITPQGRAGGSLGGRPRQGETGGCEEGCWETNQERPGTSCQRRSSWFCRRDSCHAETASGLMASRAGRLRVAAVSAGNPRPVCSAG